MLSFGLPSAFGVTGTIPFTNIRWDDLMKMKLTSQFAIPPWEVALREAEARRLGAQARLLEEQAYLTSAQRSALPYELAFQQARTEALRRQTEPSVAWGDLLSKLLSYLGIESIFDFGGQF